MAKDTGLTRFDIYTAKLGEHLITPKSRLYDSRYLPTYEVLYCPNLEDHPLLEDKLQLDKFRENIASSWNFRNVDKVAIGVPDEDWVLADAETSITYTCSMEQGRVSYPIHSLNFTGRMEVDLGCTLNTMGGGIAITGDLRGITLQVGDHFLFYYPYYQNWRMSGETYEISDGGDFFTLVISKVGNNYYMSTSEKHHFLLDFDADGPISIKADNEKFSVNRIIKFKDTPYTVETIIPGQLTQGVMYSDEFFRMLEIGYLPPVNSLQKIGGDWWGDMQDNVRGGWVCDIPQYWMDDELLARYPTFMKQRYLPPGWNE